MRMIIAGEWTSGRQEEELRSPYDHEVIETVPVADVADVDRAIACGRAWRETPASARRRTSERQSSAAPVTSLTRASTTWPGPSQGRPGKPIGEARGEASRVGDLLRLSGFEGSQLYGDSLPLDAAPNGGTSRLGLHAATAVRGGRRDHSVQFSGTARRPQDRTRHWRRATPSC